MKKYFGWIFVEKTAGMKDYFSVQCEGRVTPTGYGEQGAAAAVAFFENEQWEYADSGSKTTRKGKGLGPIKLEQTPIGLRVFQVVSEEVK